MLNKTFKIPMVHPKNLVDIHVLLVAYQVDGNLGTHIFSQTVHRQI